MNICIRTKKGHVKSTSFTSPPGLTRKFPVLRHPWYNFATKWTWHESERPVLSLSIAGKWLILKWLYVLLRLFYLAMTPNDYRHLFGFLPLDWCLVWLFPALVLVGLERSLRWTFWRNKDIHFAMLIHSAVSPHWEIRESAWFKQR